MSIVMRKMQSDTQTRGQEERENIQCMNIYSNHRPKESHQRQSLSCFYSSIVCYTRTVPRFPIDRRY